MITGLRTMLRGSTYTGALFAYCGALASLPLLPLAMLPPLWLPAPYALRAALTLLLWAVLIGVLGLTRTTRRALVASARRLLGVPLPGPAAKAPGADRWRTPLWLLLHVALGWTGLLVSFPLLLVGLSLPVGRLDARVELNLFGWSPRTEGGWFRWVAAVVCVLVALAACAAVAGVLRWAAPRLLGPSAAERLAVAAERERRLAERNRLAHELHDSIGHTLTAATIQAAVAGEVLAADPVAARAAMRSIEESTRAALEDLDYVLGALREEEAGTAPTRTLADLPELLDRLRHAGAVVQPELSGDLAQTPGTPSRAAYRILQEGLTNALRHGAGGPITVRVTAAPGTLELLVANRTGTVAGAGTGAVAGAGAGNFPTSGHGLPGLAERVRLLNGEFEAGPDGAGNWRLAVRLPVRVAA